jgi:hypothetical protein
MNLNLTAVKHSPTGFEPFVLPHRAVASTVYFGVPDQNGNCVQVGICRLVLDQNTSSKENRRCRLAKASAFTLQDGSLGLFFAFEDLLPCTERAIFKNKRLPVPVACPLPTTLLEKLEEPIMPIIAKGNYPIAKVAGGYLIAF